MNIQLISQMSTLFSQHFGHEVTAIFNRISTLTGAVFPNISKALSELAEQEAKKVNELMAKATQTEEETSVYARIALAATTTALLFICVFAIKSLLLI